MSLTLPPSQGTSSKRSPRLIQIKSMKLLHQFRCIGQVLSWLPCSFIDIITGLLYQILQLATPSSRVQHFFHIIFFVILNLDTRRWLLYSSWKGWLLIRFYKRNMKDWMYLHGSWQLKTKCHWNGLNMVPIIELKIFLLDHIGSQIERVLNSLRVNFWTLYNKLWFVKVLEIGVPTIDLNFYIWRLYILGKDLDGMVFQSDHNEVQLP